MKLFKNFLWIAVFTLISFFGFSLADDCFDTVVDNDGTILYIDPNDKYSVFEDREKLISIYWNKIECSWSKKVYSSDEYIDLIFGDLYQEMNQDKNNSSTKAIIELVMLILSCVAMWRIFTKAGKPGIYSIIPIYNFYELSDIAWLSWLFNKACICLIAWILIYFFIPMLGMLLILIFGIYMCIVNYNVARNFGWSVFASILYVIFNSVAMLILAFWNDKYYITEEKDKLEDEIKKRELENLVAQWIKDKEDTEKNMWNMNEEIIYDKLPKEKEIKIKYIDPNDIN